MGELEAIGPEAALARELRTLFAALGLSQNRYAARVPMDKGTLSRYLNGARVPTWDFVRKLLVESTLQNDGMTPTAEVVGHLRALHRAALAAGGSPAHHIQLLQEKLAEADGQAQRAHRRERELETALHELRRLAADLEIRCRELEDAADHQADGLTTTNGTQSRDTDDERSVLRAEIERLTRELERAQQRRIMAETRCEELERQLETVPTAPAAPVGSMAVTRENTLRRTRNRAGQRQVPVVPPALVTLPVPTADSGETFKSWWKDQHYPSVSYSGERLRQASVGDAAVALGSMGADTAQALAEQTDTWICDVLNVMTPYQAARMLDRVPDQRVVRILRLLPGDLVSKVVNQMASEQILGFLVGLDGEVHCDLLACVQADHVAAVTELMTPIDAGWLLRNLDAESCADVLEETDPVLATAILAVMDYQATQQALTVLIARGHWPPEADRL